MAAFSGKAFLLGIQHLDAPSRELFAHHGDALDGRLSLVEQVADEAMLRLAHDLILDGGPRHERTR